MSMKKFWSKMTRVDKDVEKIEMGEVKEPSFSKKKKTLVQKAEALFQKLLAKYCEFEAQLTLEPGVVFLSLAEWLVKESGIEISLAKEIACSTHALKVAAVFATYGVRSRNRSALRNFTSNISINCFDKLVGKGLLEWKDQRIESIQAMLDIANGKESLFLEVLEAYELGLLTMDPYQLRLGLKGRVADIFDLYFAEIDLQKYGCMSSYSSVGDRTDLLATLVCVAHPGISQRLALERVYSGAWKQDYESRSVERHQSLKDEVFSMCLVHLEKYFGKHTKCLKLSLMDEVLTNGAVKQVRNALVGVPEHNSNAVVEAVLVAKKANSVITANELQNIWLFEGTSKASTEACLWAWRKRQAVGLERITRILKRVGKLDWFATSPSVGEIEKRMEFLKYENPEHEGFALVAASVAVPEDAYDRLVWEWLSQGCDKKETSIRVMEEINDGNYSIKFLENGDPRILFAGALTNCCQHPSGAGASSAWHAATDSNGSVIAVFKDETIIAQSWVWQDRDKDVLVFDNVEGLSMESYGDIVFSLYSRAAVLLYKNGYKDVVAGLGHNKLSSLERLDKVTMSVETPEGCYTDVGISVARFKEELQ